MKTIEPIHAMILLAMFILGASGCQAAPPETPTVEKVIPATAAAATPSQTPQPSATPSLTVSATATETALPTETPIPTVTGTPTIPPESKLKIECLEILPTLPPNINQTGKLVLTLSDEATGTIIFIDLKNGQQVQLPKKENELISQLSISPDRNLLAYRKTVVDSSGIILQENGEIEGYLEDWIIVTDSSGQQLARVPYKTTLTHPAPEEGDWESFYWLDNQRLIINTWSLPEKSLIINPFTEEEQELIADYPHIDLLADLGVFWDSPVIYNTTLDRVAYIGQTGDKFEASLVLLDLLSHQVLLDIPTHGAIERPKWSPDESQLIFAMSEEDQDPLMSKQELFIIGREGQITRLTQLTDIFESVGISYFNWSPDGHKIAFWWTRNQEMEFELAVVNTTTHEVTSYCLREAFLQEPTSPIWSPDGQLLLVAVEKPQVDGYISSVVLVDLVNGSAFEVTKNMIPAGWLVGP